MSEQIITILDQYSPDTLKSSLDSPDLNTAIAKDLLKLYQQPEGFDKVGFARPLGGFFYQFFFAILGAVVIALTYSQFLRILYPYPDSKGYTSVGNVLFSFLFFIMNIPTAYSLERFIGEWAIKNPAKMIQYIRFYIWYQMTTGVFLVAGTSIFTLYFLNTGNLMYAKWLMLILISREYPAMTSVFNASIKGLQQFHYESKISFISDTVIGPLCEVIFVLWGRYVLGANPMFGEIMGIAIGFAIGTYVKDFFVMGIAMMVFRKCLKPYGFTLFDTIIPHVDKDVWKSSLKFGLALSPPGIVSSLLGLFTFFWWYDLVPAYATLLVLNETADTLANLIKRGGGVYLKSSISESLNNGKKELTHYYIAMAFKFSFMSMISVGIILYSFIPIILELFLTESGVENWLLVVGFIVPNIIATTLEQPIATADDVILGGNRPKFHSFVSILGMFLNLFFDYLILFVFQWPQTYGLAFLIWMIPMKSVPKNIIVIILDYIYIQKSILQIKFRDFAWQTLGAPILAAIAVWFVSQAWFLWVYPPLLALGNIYISGALTIVIGFLCLLWVFYPLYTVCGGWDAYNIQIFHEAVNISGPSRILFRPIDVINRLFVKSPLHNRYPIPWEKASQEAEDLMKERFIKSNIVKYLEIKHELNI